MATRSKAPTIRDVAAEAGVSKSAVSRALLGHGEVSAPVRELVEEAVRRLGYVGNALASGLTNPRTFTLGVVLRDVTRPFYAELQASMQAQAEKSGYQIVTVTSGSELEVADALRSMERLIALQVDGLIIASARLPSEQVVPFVNRVPVVVAGRSETSPGITSVFCDDVDGGTRLARRVLSLGHREVAVMLVERAYSHSQNTRGEAMIETVRAGGGVATVWPVPNDAAAAAITEAMGPTEVSAVMCPTDAAALDVMEVLRLRGLEVPRDVSVTGYDGFGPLAAPYIGLTTFRVPIREMGRTSVELVIDKIDVEEEHDRLVALRGKVIEGRTAAVPGRGAG